PHSCTAYLCPCSSLRALVRPPPKSPLFPYTPLFRSHRLAIILRHAEALGQTRDKRGSQTGTRSGPVTRAIRADWRCYRPPNSVRSEEHTSELQSRENLVCRLLLEKNNKKPQEFTLLS